MGGCSSPFTVVHLAVRPKRFPADYASRISENGRHRVFNPMTALSPALAGLLALRPLAKIVVESLPGSPTDLTIALSQKK